MLLAAAASRSIAAGGGADFFSADTVGREDEEDESGEDVGGENEDECESEGMGGRDDIELDSGDRPVEEGEGEADDAWGDEEGVAARSGRLRKMMELRLFGAFAACTPGGLGKARTSEGANPPFCHDMSSAPPSPSSSSSPPPPSLPSS